MKKKNGKQSGDGFHNFLQSVCPGNIKRTPNGLEVSNEGWHNYDVKLMPKEERGSNCIPPQPKKKKRKKR